MITEDYCSYEVAKLLKEKGFDESTNFVWYQHLPISLDCRNLVNKKARDYFYTDETTEHHSSYRNSRNKPEYIHGDIFSCPTHQMAMKWLREEKNLFIDISFINHYTKDEILHTGWCFAVFHLNNFDEPYYKDIEYSTYEQAVEAALKYSLENLI